MYPQDKIDIILLSCNRIDNTKKTIDRLFNSVKYPDKIKLICVDNESIDGTYEYLQEELKNGRVSVLEKCPESDPITKAYNIGFKHVLSENFIMMQDDIDTAKLEPKDVIEQLVDLFNKYYPKYGSISCRIERIPNINWSEGNDDIVNCRKASSAYFRIQKKEDYEKMGMLNEKKQWDDINFCFKMRSIGKECAWAKNLWCSHSRGYCVDRGYLVKPRKWGTGIHSRLEQEIKRKPYPAIDQDSCVPLPNQKIFR